MFEEYLPLNHADFHILLALADDERHGYAIMLHVEELTEGAVRLGPGTLYTSIKRLLASGLITESGIAQTQNSTISGAATIGYRSSEARFSPQRRLEWRKCCAMRNPNAWRGWRNP